MIIDPGTIAFLAIAICYSYFQKQYAFDFIGTDVPIFLPFTQQIKIQSTKAHKSFFQQHLYYNSYHRYLMLINSLLIYACIVYTLNTIFPQTIQGSLVYFLMVIILILLIKDSIRSVNIHGISSYESKTSLIISLLISCVIGISYLFSDDIRFQIKAKQLQFLLRNFIHQQINFPVYLFPLSFMLLLFLINYSLVLTYIRFSNSYIKLLEAFVDIKVLNQENQQIELKKKQSRQFASKKKKLLDFDLTLCVAFLITSSDIFMEIIQYNRIIPLLLLIIHLGVCIKGFNFHLQSYMRNAKQILQNIIKNNQNKLQLNKKVVSYYNSFMLISFQIILKVLFPLYFLDMIILTGQGKFIQQSNQLEKDGMNGLIQSIYFELGWTVMKGIYFGQFCVQIFLIIGMRNSIYL